MCCSASLRAVLCALGPLAKGSWMLVAFSALFLLYLQTSHLASQQPRPRKARGRWSTEVPLSLSTFYLVCATSNWRPASLSNPHLHCPHFEVLQMFAKPTHCSQTGSCSRFFGRSHLIALLLTLSTNTSASCNCLPSPALAAQRQLTLLPILPLSSLKKPPCLLPPSQRNTAHPSPPYAISLPAPPPTFMSRGRSRSSYPIHCQVTPTVAPPMSYNTQ